jgi:hypothetical protein
VTKDQKLAQLLVDRLVGLAAEWHRRAAEQRLHPERWSHSTAETKDAQGSAVSGALDAVREILWQELEV